ncbi:uncharacterized protein BO66DRAFT_389235 [Aspergillus aculeatinus CBS 121060]|uniref:Uncharacterized protein n=1 Tax=Aspergillus aculeatinus CBS 121060 TaxID=1448322 RepID=A0ACD1HHS3_9EURO|nr:hypothetical protein BO66DRAFT_389235 [Aspergillus aculeatinus CBS 121060]RAH73121.1 hypothetical protein BO66DRAFT_389235 [Aspergillus aculeatinus CBS 121060]
MKPLLAEILLVSRSLAPYISIIKKVSGTLTLVSIWSRATHPRPLLSHNPLFQVFPSIRAAGEKSNSAGQLATSRQSDVKEN